jgi:hypothetical protein
MRFHSQRERSEQGQGKASAHQDATRVRVDPTGAEYRSVIGLRNPIHVVVLVVVAISLLAVNGDG